MNELEASELAMLKAENAALRNQIYVLQGEILLLKSKTVTVWNNDDEQNWWEQRELEPPK